MTLPSPQTLLRPITAVNSISWIISLVLISLVGAWANNNDKRILLVESRQIEMLQRLSNIEAKMDILLKMHTK